MTPNHKRELKRIAEEYGYETDEQIATLSQIILLKQIRDEIRSDLEECLENKPLNGLSSYISSWEIQLKTRLKKLKDSIGYEDKYDDASVSRNDNGTMGGASAPKSRKGKPRGRVK